MSGIRQSAPVVVASLVAFALGYLATHRSAEPPAATNQKTGRETALGAEAPPQPAPPSAIAPSSLLRHLDIPVFDGEGSVTPSFIEAFQLNARQQAEIEDATAAATAAEIQLALEHVEMTHRGERSITMEVPALPEAQKVIDDEMQARLAAVLPHDAIRYLEQNRSKKPPRHAMRRRFAIEWNPGGGVRHYRTATIIDGCEYQGQLTGGSPLPAEFQQLLAAVGESL